MATANLGRIAIVPKGEWAAGSYKKLDVVRHNGAAWMALTATTDEPESAGSDWMMVVEDGEAGSAAFGDLTGTPYDNDALKSALDGKLDVSSLHAGLTLYQTTADSDYGGGYKALVTDTHDDDFDDTEQEITFTITGTEQLLAAYITEPGAVDGHIDDINITTVGRARVTQGRSTVFFRVYVVAADNTETMIAESGESGEIRNEAFEEIHCTALLQHVELEPDDRIAVKFFGNKISAGAQSVAKVMVGGDRPMRTYLPVPVAGVGSIKQVNYANRDELRQFPGKAGATAVVSTLGVFQFFVGSDEPDDDETCFVAENGSWELQSVSFDLISTFLKSSGDYVTETFIVELTTATVSANATVIESHDDMVGIDVGDEFVVLPNVEIPSRLMFRAYSDFWRRLKIEISNLSGSALSIPANTEINVIKYTKGD